MELTTQSEIIHPASTLEDIELTATIPQEMVTAQQQLIEWCTNKITVEKMDCAELKTVTDHAKAMGWKYTTLQKHYYKALKRVQYYEKIKSALVNGYYIVPNFPVQMFAIKTKKNWPDRMESHGYWANDKQQSAQELPEQEGEYKNPFPLIKRETTKNAEGKEEHTTYADDWDEFEFPLTMAKPVIMEATSRAMALKIFDQFGILPADKKTDPVIIGQIIRRANGYTEKRVSFMIAWHLNTNTI